VVSADSQRISRARCYLGTPIGRHSVFGYRALTVYGGPSQATSPNTVLSHCRRPQRWTDKEPHNPTRATPAGYHTRMVWPDPRSLAATDGITVVFSSCGY
jgi:hypothetical protein